MDGAAAAVLSISGFGFGAVLTDTTSRRIAEQVAERLPPEFTRQPAGPTPMVYVITRDGARGITITRDAVAGCLELDTPDAIRWLTADIERQLVSGSTGTMFVHAGVVGWRGHAIIIPGRSGTGKSSLVAELVRRGAVYYSDEFAVLDDDGLVHSYARPVTLRRGDQEVTDFDIAVASTPRPPLPLGMIVATAFVDGVAWAPEVCRGAKAALVLLDNMMGGRARPDRALDLAGRTGAGVVALRGPRPDASEVAGPLLERMDKLLDGGADGSADKSWGHRLEVIGRARNMHHYPARYMVLPDVLRPEDRDWVVDMTLARQDRFIPSRVIDGTGQDLQDHNSRVSRTLHDLDGIASLMARTVRPLLPYIRSELGIGWFSLDRTEVQLTVHDHGSFFSPHVDSGGGAAGRAITCVYHFGVSPDFDGGDLVLYDSVLGEHYLERAETHVVIPPTDNALICFPSDTFHEVRPVVRANDDFAGNRFAITVWFWDSGFRPWSRVA